MTQPMSSSTQTFALETNDDKNGNDHQPHWSPTAARHHNALMSNTAAGFGGGSGAADGLNTVAIGADASQQLLLTTPQHA